MITKPETQLRKIVMGWELYKMTSSVKGGIVECGVFHGDSLMRWSLFSEINEDDRYLVGFDNFDKFPEAREGDSAARDRFIRINGDASANEDEIRQLLYSNGCGHRMELIAGDICQTVPAFVRQRPQFRIALINLDVDLYEPSSVILEHLYPLLSDGGIIICDDYNIFPGETQAVNEFCRKENLILKVLQQFRVYYIQKGV